MKSVKLSGVVFSLASGLLAASVDGSVPAHRVYGEWTSCALGGGGYL